jgi:hypothetical protein
VECDTDENSKDDQGFFTVFPAIMFRFELRAKFLHQNVFFHQYYCIKDFPTELKDSLFEVFKLLVRFHTK